jgi:hypothetical protein
MGEYANDALRDYIRHGMRHNPNYVPRKRPKTDCPHCGKAVEASEGLAMHVKAKHAGAD